MRGAWLPIFFAFHELLPIGQHDEYLIIVRYTEPSDRKETLHRHLRYMCVLSICYGYQVSSNVQTKFNPLPIEHIYLGEEPRWQRSRTGRTLSLPQIHQRTFKLRVNSTKQLLNAGRGHQAPRKAIQVFERR